MDTAQFAKRTRYSDLSTPGYATTNSVSTRADPFHVNEP